MFIVAGPPGSGKSTAFPVDSFGVDFFNADDHAAALNHGSYAGISSAVREQVSLGPNESYQTGYRAQNRH